ncbi:MAG: AAA family ATPase [Oscillospiraceae bacterium]|nr:AAA family ATPase [Oscillospiraceae bacterium]
MVHYRIIVCYDGEDVPSNDVISFKLDALNNESNYLFYDCGNKCELRFIYLAEEEDAETNIEKIKRAFKGDVTIERINIESVDQKILNKIRIAQELMTSGNSFSGRKEEIFVMKDGEPLISETEASFPSSKFDTFLTNYSNYIDRTDSIKANCLYNVVFINDYDLDLKDSFYALYQVLAEKGKLIEHAVIKGDKRDYQRTFRETQHMYIIDDEWDLDDDLESRPNSPEEKLLYAILGEDHFKNTSDQTLFDEIINSNNVHITSMKQAEYNRLARNELFTVAFPHTIVMEDLTVHDKIKSITLFADEYGFGIDLESFKDTSSLNIATVKDLEMALRNAAQRKLIDKTEDFIIALPDLMLQSDEETASISAFEELESLIGLDSVKKTIKEIVALLEKRGRKAVPCLHMTFLGNPGTGKTTVARILAKLFAEVGLTKKNLLVETQRGGLVGKYLGQTAPKTADVIKRAMGGVLFIDEAYALIEREDDAFGKEAIATLVKIMEDKRDEFVCIMAGYTDEMNAMLDVNPGLRDRIQFHISFPDYKLHELLLIFDKLCNENSYELSFDGRAAMESRLKQILDSKLDNFSNGRFIRKLFERICIKQACRALDDSITENDVKEAFADEDIASLLENRHKTIGFRISA